MPCLEALRATGASGKRGCNGLGTRAVQGGCVMVVSTELVNTLPMGCGDKHGICPHRFTREKHGRHE